MPGGSSLEQAVAVVGELTAVLKQFKFPSPIKQVLGTTMETIYTLAKVFEVAMQPVSNEKQHKDLKQLSRVELEQA